MRLLVLLPCQPFPAYNGQTHRLALVARTLARHHEVALACLAEPGQSVEPTPADKALFADVRIVTMAGAEESLGEAVTRRLLFQSVGRPPFSFRGDARRMCAISCRATIRRSC